MRTSSSVTPSTRRVRRSVGALCVFGALGVGAVACGSDAVEQGTKSPTESTVGELGITGQWARATIAGTKNTAVYFTIVSAADDQLTGVSVDSSVAAKAEMHQTMMMGSDSTMPMTTDTAMGAETTMMATTDTAAGEMQMGPVDAIDVKAGTPTVLEPGGYHIMLFDLAKPLAEGDSIQLTLTFKVHGNITIDVPVLTEAP